MDRTSAILACGVSLLLCGALSTQARARLELNGVTVFPWLSGDVECVLDAFKADNLVSLAMPGCRAAFDQ
ncbi:NifB/NifX family molybdenum-iron cluster-binding protein [Pseudodesulfovibrio sp. zrk46]|uniref:NifB/NifX family molybdenum-iron cluster-binding protein n=1 Tax=Pseudodesulfovibrio sp. zrk46 TaxID=2725288 RepID=UPI001FFD3B44|nr:NifB/NifX family molybdenum-iron cluster-binding protein [Pseudodesulfovibrio sp. zrk46]